MALEEQDNRLQWSIEYHLDPDDAEALGFYSCAGLDRLDPCTSATDVIILPERLSAKGDRDRRATDCMPQ